MRRRGHRPTGGLPNEILEEVIVVYPEILLERLQTPTKTTGSHGPRKWSLVIIDDYLTLTADDVKILELRIIDSPWRAKRWLDSRCLKMAPEKTEALQGHIQEILQIPEDRSRGT